MWLGFFKECMVSLIFLRINLLSLSITFFWSQLKLWSVSHNCLVISFLSQSRFLTDLLCSSEPDFKDRLDSPSKLLHSYYSQFHKRYCFYLLQLLDPLVYKKVNAKSFQYRKSISFYEIWLYAAGFYWYPQHTVNFYSSWSLTLRYLWLALVVVIEASSDYQ